MEFLKGIADKLSAAPEKPAINLNDDSEKELSSWIRSKVEDAKNNPSRITFENNVITNTAYLLGYDNVYFDARTRQLRPYVSGGLQTRGRIHANLIISTTQNRLSRLAKNPPRYDVRPNSNDQEDKEAARLTLKVINNVWDVERVNEKRIDLYMWMQQGGHAYIKTYWDPMKGKQVPVPEEIDPLTGQVNKPASVEYEGDIAIDVCSPLEIYVDPQARSVQETPWLIQAKIRKLSYFRDQYGDKGKEVTPEGPWLTSLQNLIKLNNLSSKTGGSQTDQDAKDSAVELAYYEKPTKRFPNGRMAVVANGVLLSYKDLPIGEINFVKFDDIKIGGKFYSESIITHLRPLQDQYNRGLRRKAEFLNKGLNLKFTAPKGHGLSESSLSDTTEVIQYNPVAGHEVKPVQTPQLPQYVYTDGETLKADMGEIAGIGEVSKGQTPNASIPGIGLQLLQEADETRIGIVTESNENSWADVGRHIAKYASRSYKDKRYLKEAGQGGDYTITEFTGEALRGHDDIIVIRGSTLPNSKTLKRQDIINAHQQGYLGNPQDPKVLRKVATHMEYGDIEGLWEREMIVEAQIQRSIKEIEAGMIPQIHPDDDHQAHFDEKNMLRMTDKFLAYPPDIQMTFLKDLEAHKQYIVQAAMAEAGTGVPPMPEEPPLDLGSGPPAEMTEDAISQGELM